MLLLHSSLAIATPLHCFCQVLHRSLTLCVWKCKKSCWNTLNEDTVKALLFWLSHAGTLLEQTNTFAGSKPNTNICSPDMFVYHQKWQKRPQLNQILATEFKKKLSFWCVNLRSHKMVCHLSLPGIGVMNEVPQTRPCIPNEQTEFSVHVP